MMKDRYLFPKKIKRYITEDGSCRPICPYGEAYHGVMKCVGSWGCDECQYWCGKTPPYILCVRKPKKGER